jgi:hypothetical protein
MDELEISGKRYISTRRAGKDHNYHADYIGQLIRAKKVEGRKIGRAWYVDANSLATYLGKEAPAHPRRVVEEPLVVGEVPEPEEEVTMPIVVDTQEEEQEIKEEIKTDIPIYRTAREAREATGLRYIADEGPLIPQVKKIKKEEYVVAIKRMEPEPIPVRLENSRPVVHQSVHQPMAMAPVMKLVPTAQKSTVSVWVRLGEVLVLGAIVFALAGLLSAHLFFTLTVDGGQSASVGYSIK